MFKTSLQTHQQICTKDCHGFEKPPVFYCTAFIGADSNDCRGPKWSPVIRSLWGRLKLELKLDRGLRRVGAVISMREGWG